MLPSCSVHGLRLGPMLSSHLGLVCSNVCVHAKSGGKDDTGFPAFVICWQYMQATLSCSLLALRSNIKIANTVHQSVRPAFSSCKACNWAALTMNYSGRSCQDDQFITNLFHAHNKQGATPNKAKARIHVSTTQTFHARYKRKTICNFLNVMHSTHLINLMTKLLNKSNLPWRTRA